MQRTKLKKFTRLEDKSIDERADDALLFLAQAGRVTKDPATRRALRTTGKTVKDLLGARDALTKLAVFRGSGNSRAVARHLGIDLKAYEARATQLAKS